MSLLRAFIALEIPAKVQKDIYHATSNLRSGIGSLIRWVPAENMHLTLKFLGDISPANVEFLTQMIRAEADSHPCFDIHLTGLGSFPSPKRPRVIYIGIQAPAELETLQHAVESAAHRLGYASDANGGRSFSPHLTIGRVKHALRISAADQQKIRRALEETKIDSLGTARVDAVHLYKSELKPTGSVYTRLYSAQLKKS
ncbi:MAG: RNA 2',3'-cyclic phosphodiesterase [Anaerolineae bacterium]|nr:RNA 2',3'-cyclic phosphodiesterase [Anaerolineae bacterium]